MDSVETNDDLRLRRLSLIDFASEDDFLLASPSCALRDVNSLGITKEDHENIEQLEAVECSRIEERTDSKEQKEHEPQLLPSLEPERTRKNGKYNLRKSLAWDSAFFTSAGVLDPEELSCMIEQGDKNVKHVLPIIPEDLQKSSDSISTLESENMPLESVEETLFGDVRASIQKSSRFIGEANLRRKEEAGQQEARKPPSSRRFELTSQNKMKDRSASKKQTDGSQGPVRTIKQSSPHPRGGQVKVVAKLPSTSAMSNKKPGLGPNLPTNEINSTNSAAGRGVSVGLRNTTHKLTPMSTAAKKEQTTSSKFSVNPSDNVGKSSVNSARRKIESKASPTSGTHKTASQISSKVKTPVGNSHSFSYMMSRTKRSSGISPASSVSEWSTESSSSSTFELQSNGSRASLHSISSKRVSIDSDASHGGSNRAVGPCTQMTGLPSQSVKKASAQSSIPPASSQPSGLRLPSPKIGFFDGVKTSSIKSDLAVPGGLMKVRAGIVSTSVGQNKTKPAKPSARVSLKNSNHSTRPNASNINLKSPKPGASKISRTNELEENIKESGTDELNIATHGSNVSSESNQNFCTLKEEMKQENEAGCKFK